MRLEIRTPGDLESLDLAAFDRVPPGPGQIEVAVTASSLNFADVLLAMGRFPNFDGRQPQLGMDFAGVVTAIGPNVTAHQVGDRVGGFSENGCWATFVTCDAGLAVTLPPGLQADQAAAVSTAYATAWYGLHDIARIKPGDRVLIHSATGGVGQAAIAIARFAGAEIFATAGSPQRRALLRDMGIEHVYDSRSTEFADLIRRDTDGYGVDIVLNSLTGAAQRAGLELLSIGGRFVEIGKRDVYANTRLGLYPFRRNLAFYYVDLALMCASHPQHVQNLLRTVYRLVGDGELPTREHTAYPLAEAATAIRVMSAAEHTGKLILVHTARRAQQSGGAAGAGAGLSQRRRLHHHRWPGWPRAVPRRGDGRGGLWPDRTDRPFATHPRAQKTIARIRATGADIHVECGNIAEPATAARLVATATATGLPVRGVLHAAAVVEDATLTNITDELIDRDWAPKVYGAWHLHNATATQPLDWFCCFSSAAALLGSPGQGAYAAANSWLDGFAHWRRAQGLPATAIAWGAWAEIGRAAVLAESGQTTMITPTRARTPSRHCCATTAATPVMSRSSEHRGLPGSLNASLLPKRSKPRGRPNRRQRIPRRAEHAVSGGVARPVRRLIGEQLSLILRRTIDPDRPFADHGLDSLGNLEIRTHIETETGIRITPKAIATHNTVRALAQHLSDTLSAEQTA